MSQPLKRNPVAAAPTRMTVEVDDYWSWADLAHKNRWTDGLPVAPPTEERVGLIVDALGGDPDEILGAVPPAGGQLTLEQLAVNCAMAGALPEHACVVRAAMEALLEPDFNLRGVQCTTNPAAPLVIVSGPIVDDLGFNSSYGSFGGGSHANAAVGRAVRLVMWNLGRAYPGEMDMSPLGQPGKYAFCTAEQQTDNPWPHIVSDFGLSDNEDAVIVFACQPPEPMLTGGDASRILEIMRTTLPTTGVNMFHAGGQYLISMSPRVAEELERAGYGRTELRHWLFEHASYNVGSLRRSGLLDSTEDDSQAYWMQSEGVDLTQLSDDSNVPMVADANSIHVLVSGGRGQWWSGFSPGWGGYGGSARAQRISR